MDLNPVALSSSPFAMLKLLCECERPNDIPILVEHFLTAFRRKSGKPIEGVSPEAMALLRRHRLPGNVRELENAIEHAFVMCHGVEIKPEHLPLHITSPVLPQNGNGQSLNEGEAQPRNWGCTAPRSGGR